MPQSSNLSRIAHRTTRALALGLCAASVLVVGSAFAATTTTQDLRERALPGVVAGSSLARALHVPTAERRWDGLSPFGSALFAPGAMPAPVEGGPVGPDYVLGPGDQMLVFVSSLADTSYALTLDRDGRVFIPRVGSTYLWGMGFADAERAIRARIATVYRNARVQVSMGRMRSLDVLVLGGVVRPGKVTLTGAATVFHALAAAGGPTRLGGLRDLRVMRGDREVARGDLYPFLLAGDRTGDPRLENGDVLFVGAVAGRVGVRGEVARPAVYELRGTVTLREVVKMAGGPTPYADLVRVRVERVDPNGGFRVEDLSLAVGATADTFRVRDQDLVTVLPVVERSANTVTLDGYVRHPGEYEWRTGMRLSSLVTRDRLLTEADLEHVEFRRVDPVTLQAEVRTLSLRSVWDGTADLELRPLDAVTVYSGARLPASVTLDGEVVRPGRYSVMPGERLSAVLARAGGVTSSGSIRGAVFRRPSASGTIRSQRRELLERRTIELDRQMQMAAGDTAALRAINVQRELLASLDASADVDRIAVSLDDRGRWVGGVRDLVLEDGDRITVPPLSATVTVLGSVMNPGTVAARKSAGVADYVELAGGYARDADRRMSFVLRAGGDAVPIDKVGRVEPGDAVVVATRPVDTRSTSRALGNASQYLLQLATAAALVLAAVRP